MGIDLNSVIEAAEEEARRLAFIERAFFLLLKRYGYTAENPFRFSRESYLEELHKDNLHVTTIDITDYNGEDADPIRAYVEDCGLQHDPLGVGRWTH